MSKTVPLRFRWRDAVIQAMVESSPFSYIVVLIVHTLVMHMDAEGACWPSVPAIARKTGLSERSVRKALRELERAGWLRTETGGGKGNSNRYQALIPADYRGPNADQARNGNPGSRDHAGWGSKECGHKNCTGSDHCLIVGKPGGAAS